MSTTTVSKEIEFDAGHRVPDHGSKCRSPHGHRYRVRVTCSGDVVDEAGAADNGMVVDFGDLKRWMTELLHDPLDHAMIVYREDVDLLDAVAFPGHRPEGRIEGRHGWAVYLFPYVPTAENIARWCFDQLAGPVAQHWRGMSLDRVEVWETPTSCATFIG